ncbi:MAG: WG repeat-containing protein, partial [Zoogloeaceae bacterium]|nr:WG repeat-containing protein [Zoogloeaceae bacterium]
MQRPSAKNVLGLLAFFLTPPLVANAPLKAEEWIYVNFDSKERNEVSVTFSGHVLTEAQEEAKRNLSIGDRLRLSRHERENGFDWNLKGYLKPDGEFLILEDAEAFDASGVARVRTHEGRGFLDAQGNFLGRPRFLKAGYFLHGLAPVEVNPENWGYIDRTGVLVIPANFQGADDFAANGLAAAQGGKEWGYKWGYIDRKGAWAIPPAFKEAKRFTAGGVAVVLHDRGLGLDGRRWQIIDATGKTLMGPLYVEPEPLFHGQFLLLDDRGRRARASQVLIDIAGGKDIPLSPYRFHEGKTIPQVGNLLWLADEDGRPRRFLNPGGKIVAPPDGELIEVVGPPSKSAILENRAETFFLYGKEKGGEGIRTILNQDGNFVARFKATRYLRSLGEGWLSYEQGG